jgi:D-alanyl-D-alanine-carboxypeptidase/D-alanyl-D-alanine-endopeptidase
MPRTEEIPCFRPSHFPSDEDVLSILADRVDVRQQSVGTVIGMLEGGTRRVLSYGCHSLEKIAAPDGDSVFEIGSITKVYTAMLLAEMARRGEVSLDEPVEDLLPQGTAVPKRRGQKIALRHLSTHCSGLPRMPDNFNADGPDPYRHYTVEDLYQFLSNHTLTCDVGTVEEYSNLGVGLLGHALACRAGKTYEALLRERVLEPLGLDSTAITLSRSMSKRLAPGHDAALKSVPGWNLGPSPLEGAGALRSTVNDQLTLLETIFGHRKSNLDGALEDTLTIRQRIADDDVALGWGSRVTNDDEMFGHDGGTAGYRSMLLFYRHARVGVVLLSNAAGEIGDIAHHLLDPDKPLIRARARVPINPTLLQSYAGRYELRSDFVITVAAVDQHLIAQASGQGSCDIFPESNREFFAKFDVQIAFNFDAHGAVVSMTLR